MSTDAGGAAVGSQVDKSNPGGADSMVEQEELLV
jgi:hypothetical protein